LGRGLSRLAIPDRACAVYPKRVKTRFLKAVSGPQERGFPDTCTLRPVSAGLADGPGAARQKA